MKNYKPNASEIADKRFGQNFLEDESVVEQIIQAMPDDDLPVVEIGPGLGDLTKKLVQVRRVTAYEVDKRLCDYLGKTFSREIADGRLRLECGDVLERWSGGSLCDRPYRLVANLPYYIATTIILKALRDPHCRSTLTMVQKEVAEKFAAHEGDRNFSALSVLAQSAGEAAIRLLVPPAAFNPPPQGRFGRAGDPQGAHPGRRGLRSLSQSRFPAAEEDPDEEPLRPLPQSCPRAPF